MEAGEVIDARDCHPHVVAEAEFLAVAAAFDDEFCFVRFVIVAGHSYLVFLER